MEVTRKTKIWMKYVTASNRSVTGVAHREPSAIHTVFTFSYDKQHCLFTQTLYFLPAYAPSGPCKWTPTGSSSGGGNGSHFLSRLQISGLNQRKWFPSPLPSSVYFFKMSLTMICTACEWVNIIFLQLSPPGLFKAPDSLLGFLGI